MNRNIKRTLFAIFIISLVGFLLGIAVAESEVSIMGTVNEDGQLVDDNDVVYEIADTEEGTVLMEKVGEKVIVKGTVTEVDGKNTITVNEIDMAK
jgi:hypothetical protein